MKNALLRERALVYNLGKKLNKTTRVAIQYMRMFGLTYAEIAKELELDEGIVAHLDQRNEEDIYGVL